MVYKILFFEFLIISGMLYLRFKPEDTFVPPATSITEAAKQQDSPEAKPAPLAPPIRKPKSKVVTKVTPTLTFPVANHGPENVISVFGDKRGKTRLHQGIDIKAPRGTEVVATTDGFVERIKEGGSGGKQVYLRDGTGRLFYYAHLDSWEVEEFATVRAGDVLGTVGDTGNAKGTTPHLHFEILIGKKKEAVDPLMFWS